MHLVKPLGGKLSFQKSGGPKRKLFWLENKKKKKSKLRRVVVRKFKDASTGEERCEKFRKIEVLGKGGFGCVWSVSRVADGEKFAVKVVNKSKVVQRKKSFERLKREVMIHRSLDHVFICKFVDCWSDKKNYYMLLEYCQHKSFMELITVYKRFSERETKFFMYQILLAAHHLHEKLILHRDLKLGNIFVDQNFKVKIGDFGLSVGLKDKNEKKLTICGTPNYLPPEMLIPASKKIGHSYEVDVWSIGVIFFTLLVGTPPFETESLSSTYKRIRKGYFRFPSSLSISSAAKGLIHQILKVDPKQRPSLKKIMQHPYFLEVRTSRVFQLIQENNGNCNLLDLDFVKTLWFKMIPKSLLVFYQPIEYHKYVPKKILKKKRKPTKKFTKKKPKVASKKKSDLIKRMKIDFLRRSKKLGKPKKKIVVPSSVISNFKWKKRNVKKSSSFKWKKGAHTNHFKNVRYTKEEETVVSCFEPVKSPDFYAVKFIDYSNKYGYAYLLNNGACGIHFNDGTIMSTYGLSEQDGNFKVMFFQKNLLKNKFEKSLFFSRSEVPKHLAKKFTVLKLFAKKLCPKSFFGNELNDMCSKEENIFMKLLKKTSTGSCYLFRWSNKCMQFVFGDQSQVVMENSGEKVYFKSKNGLNYVWSDHLKGLHASEFKKRIKSCRGMIQNIHK